MEYIINYFKNYTNFDGRARRKELWFFYLFCFIAGFVSATMNKTLSSIVFWVLFLPQIAVASRRIHDVGKSGWFQLIPIYNIVLYCTNSEPLDNNMVLGLNKTVAD